MDFYVVWGGLALGMAFIGGRGTWMYHHVGFYPPDSRILYRNSCWMFTIIGSVAAGFCIAAAIGLF